MGVPNLKKRPCERRGAVVRSAHSAFPHLPRRADVGHERLFTVLVVTSRGVERARGAGLEGTAGAVEDVEDSEDDGVSEADSSGEGEDDNGDQRERHG